MLRSRLRQDAAICLQPTGDDIFQLQYLGTNRVKQRELSTDFLSWDPGPEGVEAKGYKCGLGLAQKVPDYLCLAHTSSLEAPSLASAASSRAKTEPRVSSTSLYSAMRATSRLSGLDSRVAKHVSSRSSLRSSRASRSYSFNGAYMHNKLLCLFDGAVGSGLD
jgi:hypothetical protein